MTVLCPVCGHTHPKITDIQWAMNTPTGVTETHNGLVISEVTIYHTGSLTCVLDNGKKATLEIKVKASKFEDIFSVEYHSFPS